MGHFFSLNTKRHRCYCAFCKTPRKVYRKKSVNFLDFWVCAIGAVVLSYILWHGFNPFMFCFFIGFVSMAEIFVRLRWRLFIVCKYCGFDPVTYMTNPSLAAAKVKDFLEKRKNDPEALLGPILNLPRAKKSDLNLNNELKSGSKKGTLISKQV